MSYHYALAIISTSNDDAHIMSILDRLSTEGESLNSDECPETLRCPQFLESRSIA